MRIVHNISMHANQYNLLIVPIKYSFQNYRVINLPHIAKTTLLSPLFNYLNEGGPGSTFTNYTIRPSLNYPRSHQNLCK